MPKDILESAPSWIQEILLPLLDNRIRSIVSAEVDRWMELTKKIDSIDKRLAVIESNPMIVALGNLSVSLASKMIRDFEEKIVGGNPLNPQEIGRRRELTTKLENETINSFEAKELHGILTKELEEARTTGNFLAALAILFLLGLLIVLLSE